MLKDDTHSQGRRVAIGAGAVKDALGYTPKRVYGTHEDGSKWSRAVTYDAGMLVFEVPHFSSNTVTFSGEVSLTGSYSDGSSVGYELSSLDSVSNFSINVSGETSTEWENVSKTDLEPSATNSLSIAGNAPPTGPNSSSPELTVTDNAVDSYNVVQQNGDGDTDQSIRLVGDSGGDTAFSSEMQIKPDASGTIQNLTLDIKYANGDDYGYTVDIYIVQEGTDETYGEGTQIKSGWDPSHTTGKQSVSVSDYSVSSDTTYTIEFVTSGTDNDGTQDSLLIAIDTSASSTWATDSVFGGESAYPDVTVTDIKRTVSSVSVSDGAGTSVSFGDFSDGESKTKTIDLSTSSSELNFSGAGPGDLDYTLKIQERSKTVDPVVTVNGETTSYSGTLSDGETVSLSANDSWVKSSNTVNVSVGDGTLSADAPSPSVNLDYVHDASDKQSVNYSSEKWRESYNVSKTFASDRSSVSLTIPFAGDVVGISSIETRVNGGTWSSVSQSSYSLSNTTLTVNMGSVNGGDTVEVRTTARRVNVVDGSITVTEPTVKGERLDTKFRIDSWSTDAHISVGATPDAGRINYAYKASWSNADPYAKITADGYNFVYLPAASSGGEARMSTIPVRVNPTSGEVRVSVDEPRTQEPQFVVRPGAHDGDTVDFTYLSASDDTHYVLKSETNDVVRADGTANSPLTLEDDDSAETLVFLKDPVSSDSGVVGPVDVGGDSGDPLSSPTVVVIAWGLLTAGFYVMHRRIGGPSGLRIPFVGAVPFPGGIITAVGSVGSGLLIIEFYSGRVSTALASVIESVGPIAGIAAVGIVVWWAYNQFRGRPVVIDQ
ncbi:hypothetical protein [Haloplanus natans]|uniref:hypothetical protein n=1 Tax=Haloplanus natans TaxID=376171 RepID=UPI00146F958E|nr:hypothetical protein [Haloplanus natans]